MFQRLVPHYWHRSLFNPCPSMIAACTGNLTVTWSCAQQPMVGRGGLLSPNSAPRDLTVACRLSSPIRMPDDRAALTTWPQHRAWPIELWHINDVTKLLPVAALLSIHKFYILHHRNRKYVTLIVNCLNAYGKLTPASLFGHIEADTQVGIGSLSNAERSHLIRDAALVL